MAYPKYKAKHVTTVTSQPEITPVSKHNKGFMIFPAFISGASRAEINLYSNPTGGEIGDSYTIYWGNNDPPFEPVHIPFRVHSITSISTAVAYFVELI